MTAFLTIPDDPAAIPAWLDGQLLGPHLRRLVGELRVVYKPGPKPDLRMLLGRHRDALLAGGFTAIPRPVFAQLLRNPDLLLDLPELVYAEGGEFWFAAPLTADEQASASRVADRVHAALLAEPRKPARSLRWLNHIGVSVATAAAVLVAVYLGGGFPSTPPPSTGWGFAKVQDLPKGEPRVTFTRLADLADEWGNKPTDDRVALAKRLGEFRLGCSALQAADLGLSDEDARWLKVRCLDWADAIDRHLRDLDTTGDVVAVRTAATDTARGIAAELRERAG